MIRLVFAVQRETFFIIIKEREIWFKDRRMPRMIRCVPKDEDADMFKMVNFELSRDEKREYDNAKTEEDLAKVVIKDVRKVGGRLLKQENG